MTELTRRRDNESAREEWNIFYDDVCIGSIRLRARVPNHADQWEWKCGFHPGCDRLNSGPAGPFEQARAAFEAEWRLLLPTRFPGLARPARLDQAQAGDVGTRGETAFSTAVVADVLSLRRPLIATPGRKLRTPRAQLCRAKTRRDFTLKMKGDRRYSDPEKAAHRIMELAPGV
ncbi:hypothetical protein [Bradyrhizobium sp. RD5-C2]|uniref:hypothetical protein n=1 Tax=Bradyrhizobium sp. RD5-C2 TaxID=244562 RepID=UPI001CC7D96C|nr:hypothetical protein [Bradyrhizobium sp. RD5-C2]